MTRRSPSCSIDCGGEAALQGGYALEGYLLTVRAGDGELLQVLGGLPVLGVVADEDGVLLEVWEAIELVGEAAAEGIVGLLGDVFGG